MSSEDDSAGDSAVVICMRVGMLEGEPVEGATEKACVECGSVTWLSPASARLVKRYDAEVVCVICIGHTFGDITIQDASCEQKTEMKENVR